jgi:flavin reductase (DIM6/NTAB) family NADH-FMN oxidoreductase RutF
VSPTQTERRETTTAALVEAARELFAAHGYAATSLDAIAAKAGLTKGAIYHHFRGKRDLFDAVLARPPMARRPTAEAFEELVGDLDYPMFIATTACEDERAGCLLGFATQCSIDPPRFLVCLSNKNRTYRVARRADALAVHFVPSSAEGLAELFGGTTGDDVDKFSRCDWRPGPGGVPILAECDNWFVGAIAARHDFGDHVGFLLDPIDAGSGTPLAEFTFHRARRIDPGHEP